MAISWSVPHDLRGLPEVRSSVGLVTPLSRGHVPSHTQISQGNLYSSSIRDPCQDIVWLDVPVNQIHFMQVLQAPRDLPQDVLGLRNGAGFFDELLKVPVESRVFA